ncbi:hypothetical protein [Neobacillus terrae]|uniref:hypothetical protein n=1 Tax=Neobacillus terrae TaxID=3034837 RepID=UPI00140937E2|nr:hypothetical protein [Neobacillus terrae]NHM29463.1 hypothetical protein [Neobacillus terrae]
MEDILVNGLKLKNIKISEVGGYNGIDIHFTFQDNDYLFMIAKTNPLMPLNILHQFKENGLCPLCKRTIYQYPIGSQPCMEFKKMDKLLLEKFKAYLPAL